MINWREAKVAIHYETDGYRFDNKIMGRQAAGMGFLQALSRTTAPSSFVGWCNNHGAQAAFTEDVRAYQNNHQAEVETLLKGQLDGLHDVGTLYTPGPDLARLAWLRNEQQVSDWNLCGVTHTTCSERVIQSIGDMVVAPVQHADALVCTSSVAKQVVEDILDRKEHYLAQSIGAKHFVRPMLPVIPLGVDVDAYSDMRRHRAAARQQLNIPEQDLVVMFAGRLSFHAKANPIPMYMALQQLASKYRIHIVHFGVFANEGLEKAFKAAAADICPHVSCHWLDGTVAANKTTAWACADVFSSLADNIQETFGLTPVEAMAAGLPQVISDWDGYKDTVRHGVDGFRVRTVTLSEDMGKELATRYHQGVDNYDYYIGHVSQFVAVDVGECVQAFDELFQDPELRVCMGRVGQQRAQQMFDWQVVIGEYKALWQEQAERRNASASTRHHQGASIVSPFNLYRSFPSAQITPYTRVQICVPADAAAIQRRRQLFMVQFSHQVLPDEALCIAILQQVQANPGQMLWDLSREGDMYEEVASAIVWMAKQGWLTLES